MAQINRAALRRFFAIAGPFFRSELKWKAWGLVALLLGLSLVINSIGARITYIHRDFSTALNLKNSEMFYKNLWL